MAEAPRRDEPGEVQITLELDDVGSRGGVVARREGDQVGVLLIRPGAADPTTGREAWLLPHTEVDASLEGLGVGSRLARRALDEARARGLLVRPECPYVRSWLDRHPEYADLVVEAS